MDQNKQTDLEEVIQEVEKDPNVTKVKVAPFKSKPEETIHKVDLSKPINNETEEDESNGQVVDEGDGDTRELSAAEEEVQPEAEVQEQLDGGGVTEEAEVVNETAEAKLPEGIQKLIEFMNETGGTLDDYVRLNRDIKTLDTSDVIDEYYKDTKPHLTAEERQFLIEETFGFDEDLDDEKDIKKKKIALKEQEAEARKYLENQKNRYYEEIKATDNLSADQKKAVDFFNRYNKETQEQKKLSEEFANAFKQKTNEVFNSGFEGFDYQVGDKKLRFNVKNAEEVKNTQMSINNFIDKFAGEDKKIQDAVGYHKSLYTAMNADAIAQHFYEQGRADAIKDSVAKAKNVNTDARQVHGETNVGGVRYRVVGDSARDFKIKRKR